MRSIVQCPACGFKVTEKMPRNSKLDSWTCPACGKMHQVNPNMCCVFCEWGSRACSESVQELENLSGDEILNSRL